MSETITCFCCNSDKNELITNKGQFNIPLKMVMCSDCGFVFLNPRKSKEEYIHFYTNEYDKYYRPSIINFKAKTDNDTLGKVIKNRISSSLPKCNNIMEIGSGSGFNLISLMEDYPDSNYYAIEPSESSKTILERNNIKVISNDADSDWDKNERKYDLIIMRHVLEHMMDPISVLKKIANSLTEEGLFYVAVPNAYKPKSPFQESWVRFPHTFYFSPDTLTTILQKSGLEVVNKLVQGDEHNQYELFGLTKKSKSINEPIINDNSNKQREIFDRIMNKESKFGFKMKNKLNQLKKKIKQ